MSKLFSKKETIKEDVKESYINTKDISHESISKTFVLKNGNNLTVTIKDAFFGENEGKSILLDELPIKSLFNDLLEVVSKNSTKYNPIPKSITISHDVEDISGNKVNMKDKSTTIVRSFMPRWSLDNVYVDESAKTQILSSLAIIKNQDKLYKEWGLNKIFKQNRSIVFNFYGKPGTGKTLTGEAIANYLGKKVYQVNYAELESKYVGETPKNIVEAFKNAQADDAILIFDEADSFLGKRLTNVNQSADYGVNITRSVMLMEIEKYEGIVVFTTNLISNYDEAFKRRIFASIEFKMPDVDARRKIWEVHIPKELPLSEDISCDLLAEKYDGISGADVKDMIMSAASTCIQDDKDIITIQHFDIAYSYIKNRYAGGGEFSEAKVVNTEVISKEQYEAEMSKVGESCE